MSGIRMPAGCSGWHLMLSNSVQTTLHSAVQDVHAIAKGLSLGALLSFVVCAGRECDRSGAAAYWHLQCDQLRVWGFFADCRGCHHQLAPVFLPDACAHSQLHRCPRRAPYLL